MIKKISLSGKTVEYEFVRKNIKKLHLRVREDCSVYVSAPQKTPMSAVEAFIRSNEDFLFAAIKRQNQKQMPSPFTDGGTIRLLGEDLPVSVIKSPKNHAELSDCHLYLYVKNPSDSELCERVGQEYIKNLAKIYLTETYDKIYPLFSAYGFEKPKLYFRDAKKRWGSCCASKKQIMLSYMCIKRPKEGIEYVVAHEFAHMVEMNHSARFYSVLDLVMPDHKKRRKMV